MLDTSQRKSSCCCTFWIVGVKHSTCTSVGAEHKAKHKCYQLCVLTCSPCQRCVTHNTTCMACARAISSYLPCHSSADVHWFRRSYKSQYPINYRWPLNQDQEQTDSRLNPDWCSSQKGLQERCPCTHSKLNSTIKCVDSLQLLCMFSIPLVGCCKTQGKGH